MASGAAAERIGTDAIARGEGGHADRLLGRDGDRADREIVELLPAREQLLEGRVAVGLDRLVRATLPELGRGAGGRDLAQDDGIDVMAGEHRGEQLLALLDDPYLLLGHRSKARHVVGYGGNHGRRGRRGKETDQRENGKSDEKTKDKGKKQLQVARQSKAAKLATVMDEQVAVAEQRARCCRQVGHWIVAPKNHSFVTQGKPPRGALKSSSTGASPPHFQPHVCPRLAGGQTSPRMVKQFNLLFRC